MNNKEKQILIITDLFIFALIVHPIFLGGIVGGYDPGFHMARIQTLASNIASGHFPNPIGFEYLDKFGYGIGFFYGNFFIYPFAILKMLGATTFQAYILFLVTFIILNIVSINYVVQKLFNNSWATIISAPIYLSSYYFIGTIYFRAAAGELIAFAIIPWIFLSVFKIIHEHDNYWIMLGISFSLLLVTHILSFLIVMGAVILFFLMNIGLIFKHKKIFFSFVKGALLFLGLSSVFLFSFIEQYLTQNYVSTATDKVGKYLIFVNSDWLPNQTFDTVEFVAVNGTFLVLLLIFSFLYYLIKNKGFHFKDRSIPQSFVVIALYGSLLLSSALLHFVVEIFKPLILLQVMTRVNVVILPLLTFVVTNALGEIISKFGKFKLPVTTILLAILAIITFNFPIQNNLNQVAQRKGAIPQLSVSMGEYEPSNFMNYNNENNFKVNTSFLEKHENYSVITNNHAHVKVHLDDNQQARTVMLPRLYYKGYQTKITYHGHSITKPALSKNGLVAVDLPDDFKAGNIKVTYRLTKIAKIGWVITIITLSFICWYLFKYQPSLMDKQTEKNE